jgi:MFS family permease
MLLILVLHRLERYWRFATEFYTLLIFRIIQGVAVVLGPLLFELPDICFFLRSFLSNRCVLLSMYQGGSAVGLVLGAAVVYFGGWQSVFYSSIPISLVLLFLLWQVIPKIPTAPQKINIRILVVVRRPNDTVKTSIFQELLPWC